MTRNIFVVLLFVVLSWVLLDILAYPSCTTSSLRGKQKNQVQLVAMVVADLHLAGPKTAWIDRVRRESFMKAALKRAYQWLKPQLLLVLGDVSDWGRKSTREQWEAVVQRFYDMASPFSDLSKHIAVGNHDVGDFYQIRTSLLQQFVQSFPGLDDTGSSIFTVENITFVSLNAMAMAVENSPLYLSVRSVVERAQELHTNVTERKETEALLAEFPEVSNKQRDDDLMGKRSTITGPVLLIHLPLYRTDESVCKSVDTPRCGFWHEVEGGCLPLGASADSSQLPPLATYRESIDMMPINVSKYLLSALKPRLVLSAHTHRFCERVHEDGTREVTVPTLNWRNRDDPSFLLATFFKEGRIEIEQCLVSRESLVFGVQACVVVAGIIIIWRIFNQGKTQKRSRFTL